MVICCIGTPKVIGDSVAPKVGDALLAKNINAFVYGTTKNPITALNYIDYYNHILLAHKGEFVIAIDCALGKRADIGCIKITKSGINPGKAIGKKLTPIGNIGILGQVGDISKPAFEQLKNTPQNIVNLLVEKITNLILRILEIVN